MASNLKLRYVIELVSNIGARATADAALMDRAQKQMQGAVGSTTQKMGDWSTSTAQAAQGAGKLQGALGSTADKFVALDRAMAKAGTNTSTERQIGYMQRLGSAVDAAHTKAIRLRQAMADGIEKAPEKFAEAVGAGYVAKRIMAPPLRAYASLEAAETDLKIAMMEKGGKVGPDFEAIKKIAVAQGNLLPGSTKDMTGAARELISLGITPEAVKNGGLVASTNLGVVLDIDQRQAAETTAKLREAYSLKDNELPAMADQVQRNRFAGGIAPAELLMAAKYEAPVINALHMGGLKGMSEVLTVQGMANQKGMNGGEFGTNFAEMLTRLASGPLMLAEAKKGLKADARERLDKLGIQFEFFDEKGQIKQKDGSAVKGIFAELEKFNQIKNADGSSDDKTKLEVAKAIFGSEGARPALIMAQAGVEGFEKARAGVDNQASLDERINEKLTTFAAKLESLGGTIENVMAKIGTQTGQALKPAMDGANNVLGGGISNLLDAHPTVGTAGLLGAVGVGGYLTKRFAGSLVQTLLGRVLPQVATAVPEVAAIAPSATAAARLAGNTSAGLITRAAPAAAAPLAAGGAATGASFLSVLMRMMGAANPLMLIEALTMPSEEDIAYLRTQDRMKQGYRGKGFDDPRRVDRPDFMTLSAPGTAATELPAGRSTEIKVGEGTLAINVTVTDDRTNATTNVLKPLALVRIDAGSTNPGGMKK